MCMCFGPNLFWALLYYVVCTLGYKRVHQPGLLVVGESRRRKVTPEFSFFRRYACMHRSREKVGDQGAEPLLFTLTEAHE